jgi:hypothetical protein
MFAPITSAVTSIITWSRHDTPKTINQIRRHNARHARMTAQNKSGGRDAGEKR